MQNVGRPRETGVFEGCLCLGSFRRLTQKDHRRHFAGSAVRCRHTEPRQGMGIRRGR